MTRYIDADKMKFNEAIGYTKSQLKVDSLTAKINEVVHIKINRLIDDTPTADVATVIHAHWKNIGSGHAECSNCGMTVSADYPASPCIHYCAKCGAKMDDGRKR